MRRFLPHFLIFAAVALGHASGMLSALDFVLTDLSFRLITRPASGRIVVVEIDRDSLERLDNWPWPRRYHAAVIDRLVAAGARNVALDIDFSSRSDAEDDEALADAMARADGRIVLPVFKQLAGANGQEPEIIYSSPFAPFAARARLGTVNVRLEEDGRARSYPAADDWRGEIMGSMAAVLATGEPTGPGDFFIDYGIQPDTIPRLSYADVLTGNFPGDAVAGKSVIIGATAVELGDQLAVPVYRVLSGPVLQAMAFESLVQGRAIHRTDPRAVLAIAFLIAVLLGPLYERWTWRPGFAVMAGVTAVGALAPAVVLHAFPAILDTGPCIAVTLISYLRGLWLANRDRALSLLRQQFGLRRRAMMMERVVENCADGIAIANPAGLVELLNPAAGRLLGTSPALALGRPIRELLPWPSGLDRLFSSHGDSLALKEAPPGATELTLTAKDGAERTLEIFVRSSALSPAGKTGNPRGTRDRVYIFTVRDVSSRNEAGQAQRRAGAMLLLDTCDAVHPPAGPVRNRKTA